MKVALVHDYLTRLGGAERVTATLAEMFPAAPIYTLLYDEEKVGKVFNKSKIRTSGLQKLPAFLRKKHKYFLPLLPRTVEDWDFSEFDLVITSSNSFVHGIITGTHTHHLCYYHSPMRFAWDWTHEYIKEQNAGLIKSIAAARILNKIRLWDRAAAERPDTVIANSKTVQRRIKKYYGREAEVIYPPVDLSRFKVSKNSDNYFLIISTLTPYKKIDLAIQLFNKIQRKLVIIGDGPHREYLQNIAGETIEFKGFVSDETATKYMENCRALIFPGEEDFGITPVEAMACGKPVLALGIGGVTESVIPGKTGEFFAEPTVDSMEEGLAKLMRNEKNYRPADCRAAAEKFSKGVFIKRFRGLLKAKSVV
jgi:glycosyltransferase involved in cell wall biosynthesis